MKQAQTNFLLYLALLSNMDSNPADASRRDTGSFDGVGTAPLEKKTKDDASMKPSFLQRVLRRKHMKLKRSKSDENLTEALNISIDDVGSKETRERSRTESSDSWAVNDEKDKRRGAVCEENEEKREEFTKILETFMVMKNMDDYGL